jgi:hypothetical protein
MEPVKLESSIGSLYLLVEARGEFRIRGPFESPWVDALPEYAYPHADLTFEYQGAGRWMNVPTDYDYRAAIDDETPIPQALVDELSQLGTEWANAHPEEFEKAARAEFDDDILYITRDTFGELMRIFTDAQRQFRRILEEPDFANYASMPLRRRIQKEAKRLRTMRLQVSGAAKAINTLAGRHAPDAQNQPAAQ